MIDVKKIRSELIKDGALVIKEAKIEGLKLFTKELVRNNKPFLHCFVSLTLNKDVPNYIENEDGDFVKEEMPVVTISLTTLLAALRELEDFAWLRDYFAMRIDEALKDETKKKDLHMDLSKFFNGSSIELLLIEVEPGEDEEGEALCYPNPFSRKGGTTGEIKHKDFAAFVTSLAVGKKGIAYEGLLFAKS